MGEERGLRHGVAIFDQFSALDDLTGKDRSDPIKILRALDAAKKFSCFEVCNRMAGPITMLFKDGMIQDTKRLRYPWTEVRITAEGRLFMWSKGAPDA